MRNYARKMAAVRLPPERMRELKAYCHAAREDDAKRSVVDGAMEETLRGDRLDRWIRESVLRGLGYDAMQARGIPCSRDTFRLYRARFFKALDAAVWAEEARGVRREKEGGAGGR